MKQLGGSHSGFGSTPAFAWIAANNYENAKRFGFVPSYPPDATSQGPNPEPWEYVFVGDDVLFHDGPFSDVLPNNLFVTEIEWLSGQGITRGCNSDGSHFCPHSTVDHGAMAAFINRAFGHPGSTSDYFVDDDSSIFESDINALADAVITTGCGGGNYCPTSSVTRVEFAAMLYRSRDRLP